MNNGSQVLDIVDAYTTNNAITNINLIINIYLSQVLVERIN